MVDASATVRRREDRDSEVTAGIDKRRGLGAEVFPAGNAAMRAYADACKSAVFAPPQNPAWVEAWAEHSGRDHMVVLLRDSRHPVMALALEVVRRGPFRIARFIGGSHANGNFPALTARGAKPVNAEAFQMLPKALRDAGMPVDVVALERQLFGLAGAANPLAALPHTQSPNIALAADLSGGFEVLLERMSGKRKRKKHRSQSRRFEEAGGAKRREARTPEEVDTMLDAFFAMKSARFAAMGIDDVFAPEGVRASLRALFRDALGPARPDFVLHGLDVGGKLRAITGSSRSGERIICEFGAIADDELASASPGDFLFFENISEACEEGLAVYDFSVGDEQYKRFWCMIETRHFDVFLPLTAKGRLLAATRFAVSGAKRFIKNNRAAWRIAKTLRRRFARRS